MKSNDLIKWQGLTNEDGSIQINYKLELENSLKKLEKNLNKLNPHEP